MEYKTAVQDRIKTVRLRAWTLSMTITALLVLYIFVTLSIKSTLDVVDFVLTASIQISTHFTYFPEGARYGAKDELFIAARNAYNENAARITSESTVDSLRDFCEFDYEEKKARYIADVCGGEIGISADEYAILSQKSEAELKKIETFENKGKTFHFTKKRRKALLRLVYGKCPIERNNPDTVLSAVDRDYTRAIKDKSRTYNKAIAASRLFRSIFIGAFLAYIGYNLRDGLSLEAVIKSAVMLGSMIIAAISAYVAGERSTREFKKDFYVELSTFIDRFFSWSGIIKIEGKQDE